MIKQVNGAFCGVGTGESTGFCPDLSGLPLYDVGHFYRHDKKTAVADGLCGSSILIGLCAVMNAILNAVIRASLRVLHVFLRCSF